MTKTNRKLPILLMLPAILIILSVSFFPLFYAIRQSLYETKYLKLVEYVGLNNYVKIFTNPDGFSRISISFIHVIGTIIVVIPLAFLVAIILNKSFRFRAVFRSLAILPWSFSQLIAAFLWLWILNPYYGPISYFLRSCFSINIPNLTTSTEYAMPTLIMITSWRFYPLAAIFILASLQTVPLELNQAAKIDGSTNWEIFKYITLPMIKNTVLVTVILITLYTFNLVTLTLVLTGGGPNQITETLALKTFREAFEFWHIGYASAFAVIIFLINIGLSLIYNRLLKTEKLY